MKTFKEFTQEYVGEENIDAYSWICAYCVFTHAVDDIIDQDIPADKARQQFILETFEFAEAIYSHVFYFSHLAQLRPLIKSTSVAYMNSIQWEDSHERWKRQVADALRQQGNEVLLAVIEIVKGIQVRNRASLELREISFWTHHDEEGNPI